MKTTAIVLAGGRGKRMNSDTLKQYLLLRGRPVLFYALKAFEDSFIDSVILVTAQEQIAYCQKEIVEKFGFSKVKKIIAGGEERYQSVMNGIFAADPCDYFFIHDGARPFVTQDMIQRLFDSVKTTKACVAAMPVKDTVKIADEEGYIATTPKRDLLYSVQTPQVFSYDLICEAYRKLQQKKEHLPLDGISVTDDAMVVETFLHHKIRLVEGSYRNLKITTPEDLTIAELFAEEMGYSFV